jgi:hypothetical protein
MVATIILTDNALHHLLDEAANALYPGLNFGSDPANDPEDAAIEELAFYGLVKRAHTLPDNPNRNSFLLTGEAYSYVEYLNSHLPVDKRHPIERPLPQWMKEIA